MFAALEAADGVAADAGARGEVSLGEASYEPPERDR
jgi:hypothetical protein